MCGIIGYTGTQNAVPVLIEGLKNLEYRGYDSAGIAVFDKNERLVAVKSKGRISSLEEKINFRREKLFGFCGIGHTRWATHGEPSDVNSHPHGTKNLMIVHNGIIENYSQIKDLLTENGYEFESETDTESAAKLIDLFYQKSGDPIKALNMARAELTGSYAVCAVFADYPGSIYATRKASPLVAAKTDDGTWFASDVPAILKYTNKYYRIDEDEIVVANGDTVRFIKPDGSYAEKKPEIADFGVTAADKGEYAHFMIKEIYEEPMAVTSTLAPLVRDGLPSFGNDELSDKRLSCFGRIHFVGCGTAYHAGLYGKYLTEKLARIPTEAEIASEFRYKDPILGKNDLVVLISQSGETADTLSALKLAKSRGAYTLAVVNTQGSSIATEADGVIYTKAGTEIAVASTKAYTVQSAVMCLLAIRIAYAVSRIDEKTARALTLELLNRLPEAIADALKLERMCVSVAEKYKDTADAFYIGRGSDYLVGTESALKLKEISYIHCEAYPAGELKHGTISLISDGTPVFAVANISSLFEKMISNIKEVKARGASVVLICSQSLDIPENVCDDVIFLPEIDELFSPIVTATVTQLIAYHTARLLGLDVDKPRNLAKSVTVE